ncbi:MAG: hypothetical protein OXU62_02185 [Gammaproteobacteria bacterium]|nr:hypothetical protein [Gammaproteobacteria bacterium]
MNFLTGKHGVLAAGFAAAGLAAAVLVVAAPAAGQLSPAVGQSSPGVGQALPGAGQVLPSAQDCLEIVLQDPTLTRAERIAILDKALLESLGGTDICRAAGVGIGGGVTGGGVGAGGVGVGGVGAGGVGVGGVAGGVLGGVTGTIGAANAGNAGEAANAPVVSLPAGGVQGEAPADAAGGATTPGNAPVESLPVAGVRGDAPDESGDATAPAVETAAVNPNANAKNHPANVPGAGTDGDDDRQIPDDIPPSANDDIIAQQLREAAQEETDPVTRAKLWNEYRRYKGLSVQAVPEVGETAAGETGDETGDKTGDKSAGAGDQSNTGGGESNPDAN